jgi:L-alanine-DL-glutamate epimerase-like enolase superfamily enzyme
MPTIIPTTATTFFSPRRRERMNAVRLTPKPTGPAMHARSRPRTDRERTLGGGVVGAGECGNDSGF